MLSFRADTNTHENIIVGLAHIHQRSNISQNKHKQVREIIDFITLDGACFECEKK